MVHHTPGGPRGPESSSSMPDAGAATAEAQGPRTDPSDLRTGLAEAVDEQLALMAAQVHTATQRSDKRAARRHQRDRSTVNRWRNIGRGSPCYAALKYLWRLAAEEAMRIAAMFLSAARMVALKERTTPELIALYWELRGREVEHEADDLRHDAVPHGGSTWAERADASETDAATDILIGSIERLFGIREVMDAEVYAAAPGGPDA